MKPPSLSRSSELCSYDSDALHVFVGVAFRSVRELMRGTDPALRPIQRAIADQLYEVGPKGEIRSGYVNNCNLSLDGRTYRLHLKDGARLHDGRSLSAADVAASLAAALEDAPLSSPLAGCGGRHGINLHAGGRNRLEIQLARPVDQLFSALAAPRAGFLAAPRAGAAGDCVYSGLFRPDYDWRGDGPLTLTLHEDHPEAADVAFHKVRIFQLPRDAAALTSVLYLAPVLVLGTGTLALPAGMAMTEDGARPLPIGATVIGRRVTGALASVLEEAACAAAAGLPGAVALPGPEAARFRADGATDAAAQRCRPDATRSRADNATALHCRLDGDETILLARVASEAAGRGARLDGPGTVPEEQDGLARRVAATAPNLTWFPGFWDEDPMAFARFAAGGCRDADQALQRLAGCRDPGAARRDAARLIAEWTRSGRALPLLQAPVLFLTNIQVDARAFAAAGGAATLADVERARPRYSEEELRARSLSAAGAAVQAFAHDVRRPFSMVRILMDMVTHADSLETARATCQRMIPELDAALRSVDGMIQDVLEVGSTRPPQREPTALVDVLRPALADSIAARPRDTARFEFALQHTRLLDVEPAKTRRVFANIVINALEALPESGRIWIQSLDLMVDGRPWVHVVVGNEGSHVPAEKLSTIFDPFYTAGKRGGTGLGLAICRKIVEAHGGRIWCMSDPVAGVELHFTLPAGAAAAAATAPALPATAQAGFALGPAPAAPAASAYGEEAAAQDLAQLLEGLKAGAAPIGVLAVDDEDIYLDYLVANLRQAPDLAPHLQLHVARDADQALALVGRERLDLVICDVDLGRRSRDGFQLVETLRLGGFAGKVCIHSNRGDPRAYVNAVRVGADAFLPKPMSQAHVLRLLRDALASRGKPACPLDARAGGGTAAKPVIAVIDDDPFIREAWEELVPDADVAAFAHAGAYFDELAGGSPRLERARCVVVDYFFDEGPFGTADEFLERLAATGKPVLISSDSPPESLPRGYQVLPKRPVAWRELAAILDARGRG